MTTDRPDIPWGRAQGGGTYHGFSDAPPAVPPPRRSRRPPRRAMIAGGVIAALALGLGFGFLAKPNLRPAAPDAPMRAVTPAAGAMDIEVNPPAPLPAVKPAGKLEVLPPDMAQSARPAQASIPMIPPQSPDLTVPAAIQPPQPT